MKKKKKERTSLDGSDKGSMYEGQTVFSSESPRTTGSDEMDFPISNTINRFSTSANSEFELKTNALMSIQDKKCNLFLQQLYYSERCSWFYIALLVLSFGLIFVTIFDGFQVAESPLFIVLELVLNLLIGVDFVLRIKLVGCQKYIRNPASGRIRWWNLFDALVVTVCNLVFATSLFSKTGTVKGFQEASEEALIVMWCIWQTLRMVIIAKKQRLARQSAKNLINFETIDVDTDFGGALSFRQTSEEDGDNENIDSSAELDIIEMTEVTTKENIVDNKARLRSKINARQSVHSQNNQSRFRQIGSTD